MSKNLRARLARLEQAVPAPTVGIWDVMCGAASPDELGDDGGGIDWEALFSGRRDPCPIEEQLAAEVRALSGGAADDPVSGNSPQDGGG